VKTEIEPAFMQKRLASCFVLITTASVGLFGQAADGTASKRMADGKQWTIENLNVKTPQSYCYAGAQLNCRKYGRLYMWEAAQKVCQLLGDAWHLPSDAEWRQMAKH
jgi:hypothetical protein